MQTEVGEVSNRLLPTRIKQHYAQKRNPISSVYITYASTVKQLSAALFDAMVEDHERIQGLGSRMDRLASNLHSDACDIDTHSAATGGIRGTPRKYEEEPRSHHGAIVLSGNDGPWKKSGTASCA